MTRKDYVLLAAKIREEWAASGYAAPVVEKLAMRIADALAEDNPRFDKARFMLAACAKEI